jgi:flagella basal body P-ring formation protein FlgA
MMSRNLTLYRSMLMAAGLAGLVGGLTGGLGPAPAVAAYASAPPSPFTDLTEIDREVSAFTGKSIGQNGGALTPVDRRLRLNACRSPLDIQWRTTRRDSVSVQCPDPGSWRIFVAVRAEEGGKIIVMRGEAVSIAVVGDGFSVSQPGEAMDAGAVGDWIRVRGLKEGSPRGDAMRGRVVRPGEVEVPLRN